MQTKAITRIYPCESRHKFAFSNVSLIMKLQPVKNAEQYNTERNVQNVIFMMHKHK